MRCLFIWFFILNTYFCVAKNSSDNRDTVANPVTQKLNEISAELRKQGVDTILTYLDWVITDKLEYHGDGLIMWMDKGHCFVRTFYYDPEKRILTQCLDSISDGQVIQDFFKNGIAKTAGDTIVNDYQGSGENHLEVNFRYGDQIFSRLINDHILYSSRNAGILWILSIRNELVKSMPYPR